MTGAAATDRKVRLAARAALDRKALDLVVLDVQGLSSVTDFFVVCSGRSTTHTCSGLRSPVAGTVTDRPVGSRKTA